MDTRNLGVPDEVLLQAIMSTNEGITIADAQQPGTPLVYVNPAFERITGYTKDEIVGKNCRFLQKGDHNQPEVSIVHQAIKDGSHCRVLLRNYKKDGALFWNELNLSPIRDSENTITHFVGIQKDVTREHYYQDRITYLSQHDQLTDLLNRHGFYEKIKAFYSWSKLTGHMPVVVADLDNLKTINDTFGHRRGDQLLQDYSNILKTVFRQNDLIARFGGDEFIILTAIKSQKDRALLAKQLDQVEKKLLAVHPAKVTHCVSNGIAFSANHDIGNIEHLIHQADELMYQSKKSRKATLELAEVL